MVYGIYCLKDAKNSFLSPNVDSNDASALRNFDTAVKRSDDILHFHKEDFSLYKIASFDNETGVITPLIPPVLVVDGGSLYE